MEKWLIQGVVWETQDNSRTILIIASRTYGTDSETSAMNESTDWKYFIYIFFNTRVALRRTS